MSKWWKCASVDGKTSRKRDRISARLLLLTSTYAAKRRGPDLDKTCVRLNPSYTKKLIPAEAESIDAVDDKTLFGLGESNIHVPEDKKKHFEKMPPIFKSVSVSRTDEGSTCENSLRKQKGLEDLKVGS